MAKFVNPTKVITGVCTFSYLNCWEPKAIEGGKPKFSVSLVIPKSDTKTVEKIRAAIKAAYEEGASKLKGSGKTVPALSAIRTPLRDGDSDRPDDEVYKGCWFINANSDTAPGIVDADRQPILTRSEMYSGVKGRASINLYAYNVNGNRGVACGLNNLQKIADGTPLGGKSRAEDDFDTDDYDEGFLDKGQKKGGGSLVHGLPPPGKERYESGKITTFLCSVQHTDGSEVEDFRGIIESLMVLTAAEYGLNSDFEKLINPTGKFVVGGSNADTGVTGRKLACDTYGGVGRIGGGALSGKDPTKVDRSGAYMARKIAVDLVTGGYCDRCEVQIAYAIGKAEPVSVSVDTFGTARCCPKCIDKYVETNYDLTPQGIIRFLHLLDVDYKDVAYGGHFGKNWLPWEIDEELAEDIYGGEE